MHVFSLFSVSVRNDNLYSPASVYVCVKRQLRRINVNPMATSCRCRCHKEKGIIMCLGLTTYVIGDPRFKLNLC